MSIDHDSDQPVKDYPGYFVTRDGSLRSYMRQAGGRIIKPHLDRNGYAHVQLYRTLQGGEREKTQVLLHRIVAHAFIPNPEQLPVVRHLNGVRADCRVANLAWGTYAQNEADKIAHGTYWPRDGALNREQRQQVRARRAAGETYPSIARSFNVSESCVRQCATGKTFPMDGAA